MPSFSAYASAGNTTSACSRMRLGQERGVRDRRCSRAASARSHSSRSGRSRSGSQCSRYSAPARPRRAPRRSRARHGRAAAPARSSPGPAFGQHACLAQPAAVGWRPGTSSRPAPSTPAMPSVSAISSSARAPACSVGPGGQPLAPQDHDLAAHGSRPSSCAASLCGPRSRAASSRTASGSAPASRARRSTSSSRRRARRSARRRTRHRRRARSARPARRSRRASSACGEATASFSALAAHALAQAQVEDRRVVDRLGVEHEHGVGELEVAEPSPAARGSPSARCSSSGSVPARRESTCGRAEALAHQTREQQALLVGGLPAGDRAGLRAGARQAGGGLRERALPGDRAQLAAVAHAAAR